MRISVALLAVALLVWMAATWSEAAGNPEVLPERDNGVAAKYPGDMGIEKDEAVIFAEGFEGRKIGLLAIYCG